MSWFGAVQPNCSGEPAVKRRELTFALCWRTMGSMDGQTELSAPADEEGFALMQHHRECSRCSRWVGPGRDGGSTVCGGIMRRMVGENDWKTISRGPETADIRGNNHRGKLYGKEDGERTAGERGRPSWWPTKDGASDAEANVAASHTDFTFGHDLSSLGMWHNGILSGFRGL